MKTLLRLLAVSLALSACSPQQPPQASATCTGPGSRIVLEMDAEALLRDHLATVSIDIRDTLRQAPAIPLLSREIVGDRLDVHLVADADMNAALERIGRLGGDRLVVTQGGYAVVQVRVSDLALAELNADALGPSLEAARRRLGAADLEATVGEMAPSRLCVEAPGFGAEQLDNLAELLTRPGVLTFNMVDDEADPSAYEPGVEKNGRIALPDDSLDGAPQVIFVDAVVRGSDLSGADAVRDISGQPAISFQLHPSGQSKFGKATTENLGKAFAVVLDDRILTSPRIMSSDPGRQRPDHRTIHQRGRGNACGHRSLRFAAGAVESVRKSDFHEAVTGQTSRHAPVKCWHAFRFRREC